MPLEVKDKLEIQELSARYANAMDDNDLQAWMSTWDTDGQWTGGIGTYKGNEQLQKCFLDLGERIRGKRHAMTNFVIEGDGDQATQRCYLLIVDIAKNSPPTTAVYTDRLQKRDGRWRFVDRKVAIDQI